MSCNLICFKYFMMKFIIWYYNLLFYDAYNYSKIKLTKFF